MTIDEFLVAFAQALTGSAAEKADMVAVLRGHLEEAQSGGNLDATLGAMGSPADLAVRMEAGGHGHRHLDALALPNGAVVTAATFRKDDYTRLQPPDFGLYFDARWSPPWPHEHVEWPDFGLPVDLPAMVEALRWLLGRVQAGESVEVGCLGGHGRTGVALACLALLTGVEGDPVNWVRDTYCKFAIETADQAELVRSLGSLTGRS